jgi:hypothetical protein
MTALNPLHPEDLRAGGQYLYRNGDFIRVIDSIEGDTVRWHDQYGPGMCSRKAFLKACHAFAPDTPGNELDSSKDSPTARQQEFTLRDEANALTAYAFRNGSLEDLHAGKDSPLLKDAGLSRITDDEMKRLMIEASEKLAEMLLLKQQNPVEYETWLRSYHWRFCRKWQRE